jgi:hypothetical protein
LAPLRRTAARIKKLKDNFQFDPCATQQLAKDSVALRHIRPGTR